MHFWVLGVFDGMGVCGKREGLVWLGLLERCGYSEIFGRDMPVLGRGSR